MARKLNINVAKFKGRTGFGFYDELLSPENDLHAPGTVDSVLLDEMIKLVPETTDYLYSNYTPLTVKYRKGTRPYLEQVVKDAVGRTGTATKAKGLMNFCHNIPSRFPTPEKSTNTGFWTTDTTLFGGTEEELIKRGTEICTELSRVLCVLAQVAGMPARLMYLFDMERRNWGHGVTEIYVRTSSNWAVFDATSNVCYPMPDDRLASAWDLRKHPKIVTAHPEYGRKPYVSPAFYKCSTVANYSVWDQGRYDYSWNPINDYYRKIWENADNTPS